MAKKKKRFAWLIPGFFICLIPTGIGGSFIVKDVRARNGQSKTLIRNFAAAVIEGKQPEGLSPEAKAQADEVLSAMKKDGGKPLRVGELDAVPSVRDLLKNGEHITFNLPVEYEKGVRTWVFRVRNGDGHPLIVGMSYAGYKLPHDSVRTRIEHVLP